MFFVISMISAFMIFYLFMSYMYIIVFLNSLTPEPPPIFTKELEDQFVKISEPLSLSCHIVVPPWPRSVVWYNKEGKVEASDR